MIYLGTASPRRIGDGADSKETFWRIPHRDFSTSGVLVPGPHELFGTVTATESRRFTLQTRTGSFVQVDASRAIQNELSVDLFVREAVDVRGIFDSEGALRATVIQKAKEPATWPPDI